MLKKIGLLSLALVSSSIITYWAPEVTSKRKNSQTVGGYETYPLGKNSDGTTVFNVNDFNLPALYKFLNLTTRYNYFYNQLTTKNKKAYKNFYKKMIAKEIAADKPYSTNEGNNYMPHKNVSIKKAQRPRPINFF